MKYRSRESIPQERMRYLPLVWHCDYYKIKEDVVPMSRDIEGLSQSNKTMFTINISKPLCLSWNCSSQQSILKRSYSTLIRCFSALILFPADLLISHLNLLAWEYFGVSLFLSSTISRMSLFEALVHGLLHRQVSSISCQALKTDQHVMNSESE